MFNLAPRCAGSLGHAALTRRQPFGAAVVLVPVSVLLSLFAAAAGAQSLPLRQAPIIEPSKAPEPQPAASAPLAAQSVAQVFLDGCVLNEGQPSAVVDWALAQGFEPVDPLRTGAEDLLGGTPGAVLAMPGSAGLVLLAAAQDRRCLVWAESTNGPRLRSAFRRWFPRWGSRARACSL